MARKKKLTYEQRMLAELQKLLNPLYDKKHRILIYFDNDRARSNQDRFEHIFDSKHELLPSDIKRIVKGIKTSFLKQDKERKDTHNLYILRNVYKKEYIKIAIKIDFKKSNIGKVKTIFITKNFK